MKKSDIYLFFPEEGTVVNKSIYSYTRHPLYSGSICTSLGFAILRNNLLAILTAMIFIIPNVVEIRLEDNELIQRVGENHRHYVKDTPAMFPRLRDLGKLLSLVFLRK